MLLNTFSRVKRSLQESFPLMWGGLAAFGAGGLLERVAKRNLERFVTSIIPEVEEVVHPQEHFTVGGIRVIITG